jgi:hypothetical protein
VAPTFPAPTTVTFFLIFFLLSLLNPFQATHLSPRCQEA